MGVKEDFVTTTSDLRSSCTRPKKKVLYHTCSHNQAALVALRAFIETRSGKDQLHLLGRQC